jgi:hypothetical protein
MMLQEKIMMLQESAKKFIAALLQEKKMELYPMMTPQESAKKLIAYFKDDKIKWVNRCPDQGEECLVTGAYNVVRNANAERLFFEKVQEKIGMISLLAWNDNPSRTFDDLINMLQSIADEPTTTEN